MERILNPLYPLDQFYVQAGRTLPYAHPLRGDEVPEPYRPILVHREGMTPTLEAFHGGRTHLCVLARRQRGEALWRQVVLRLDDSDRTVEFAAIVIHLQHCPPPAREEILEERRPLGAILSSHGIVCRHSPLMFFRVQSDRIVEEVLHLAGPQFLYGRRNRIRDASGRELAVTLEIVPPVGEGATRSWGRAAPPEWFDPGALADCTSPYRHLPVVVRAGVSTQGGAGFTPP